MSGRVVLSRSPYLGRTRHSRQQFEQLVGGKESSREGTVDRQSYQGGRTQVEARLMAVCDSLEAKTQQCKMLMLENEQLSNRLIQLSKAMGEPDNLSISSKMGHSRTEVDLAKDTAQSIRQPRHSAVQTDTIQVAMVQPNNPDTKLKEELGKLTARLEESNRECKRIQTELSEKTKLAEQLNRSLLQAIQSSSALMKEKSELTRKLQQTTISLKEIDTLYNNAKRYIFKGLDISQSEVASNAGSMSEREELSMGDITRMECEKSKELEIARYQLDLKTRECEQKELQIVRLHGFELETAKLRQVVQQQGRQLQQYRNRVRSVPQQTNTRLSKAHRTITNELQQIVNQLEACQRITHSNQPLDFLQRNTSELEQLASTVIARKLQVDRFMRQLPKV